MAEFPITISPQALPLIRRIVERDGRPEAFLRIGVKGGGCSGFEYLLKIDTKVLPIDFVTEIEGLTIRCDAKSAKLLAGSVLETSGNLIGGGLTMNNPNAARSCGCGTSFTPKAS